MDVGCVEKWFGVEMRMLEGKEEDNMMKNVREERKEMMLIGEQERHCNVACGHKNELKLAEIIDLLRE